MTRREKAIEARHLTRKLIKLAAQKIITLTELEEALTYMIDHPEQMAPTSVQLMLNDIHKTLNAAASK